MAHIKLAQLLVPSILWFIIGNAFTKLPGCIIVLDYIMHAISRACADLEIRGGPLLDFAKIKKIQYNDL